MEVYQDINKLKEILASLSKERLEELLTQDLADEYKKELLSELGRREKHDSGPKPATINQNNTDDFQKEDVLLESEELNKNYMWEPKSKQKLSKVQWVIIVVAIWGLIFGKLDSLQQLQRADTFSDLREVVEKHTNLPIIPNWAPEGTVLDGEVSVSERSDGLKVSGVYYTKSGQLHIRIILRDEIPAKYEGMYQINDEPVVEYIVGGVTHYLMQNFDNNMVVWINDYAEVLIQSQCPMNDLKQMIDSLY